MWLIRFLFTGRKGFVVFALLAFMTTLAYLGWYHRYRQPVVIQQRSAERLRQMHRGADEAMRSYRPTVPPVSPTSEATKEGRP